MRLALYVVAALAATVLLVLAVTGPRRVATSDPLSVPGAITASDRFAVRGRKVPTLDDELRQVRNDLTALRRPGQQSLFASSGAAGVSGSNKQAPAAGQQSGGAGSFGLFGEGARAMAPSPHLHPTFEHVQQRRMFVALKCADAAQCASVIQHLHVAASHPSDVFYAIVTKHAPEVVAKVADACTMVKAPVCALDQLRHRSTVEGASATDGAFAMYQGEPFAMVLEAAEVDAPHAWDDALRDGLTAVSHDVPNPVLTDFATRRGVSGEASAGDRAAPCAVNLANARVPSKDAPGVRPAILLSRVPVTVHRVRGPFASPDFFFGYGATVQRLRTLAASVDAADRVWDLATRLHRFEATAVVSTQPLMPRGPLAGGTEAADVSFTSDFEKAVAIDVAAKKDLAADPLRNRCRALR